MIFPVTDHVRVRFPASAILSFDAPVDPMSPPQTALPDSGRAIVSRRFFPYRFHPRLYCTDSVGSPAKTGGGGKIAGTALLGPMIWPSRAGEPKRWEQRRKGKRLLCPRGQSDFGKRADGWRRVKNRRPFHAEKVRSIQLSADNRPIPKSVYRAGFGSTFCRCKRWKNRMGRWRSVRPRGPQPPAAEARSLWLRRHRRPNYWAGRHCPLWAKSLAQGAQ